MEPDLRVVSLHFYFSSFQQMCRSLLYQVSREALGRKPPRGAGGLTGTSWTPTEAAQASATVCFPCEITGDPCETFPSLSPRAESMFPYFAVNALTPVFTHLHTQGYRDRHRLPRPPPLCPDRCHGKWQGGGRGGNEGAEEPERTRGRKETGQEAEEKGGSRRLF